MKRFLAGMLAIVLVFTSVSYMQMTEVQAMTQSDWLAQENQYTTKEQYQGLNFNTLEYNYYFAEETLDQLPATFEATIRVTTTPYRAGIILSNSTNEDTSKAANKESGTFSFGFHANMVPYLYIADGTNNEEGYVNGTRYKFTVPEVNASTYYDSFFQTKQWVHLAIVRDTEHMYCYVDGTLFSTLDVAYDDSNWVMSKAMVLGGDWRSGNTQQFIGDIKNVSIYADARTADEIASDCTAMKVENANYSPVADENLMACYALDLDATTGQYPKTLEDLSANSYNLKTYDWLTEEEMTEKGLTISSDDYSYSMAVIGDPQCLSANTAKYADDNGVSTRNSVETLYQWVKENAEAKNMKFAFNMGDTVDSSVSSTSVKQWITGSNAVKLLDGTVPYSMVRGNHDSIAYYNQYYPYEEYKDSLAGSYDENMLNTYQKFQVGDIKYLVLNLDFGIGADSQYFAVDENNDRIMIDGSGNPDKVLEWANKVVKANPGHNVIVTTHGYTAPDGTRLQHETGTSSSAPTCSSATREGYLRAYSGEDIYQKLVKDNSNIVLVLSGHTVGTNEQIMSRTVTREDGSNVVEMLVNPQGTDQALDVTGLVAMMYFSEANTETNKQDVTIQYYATLRDRYYQTENQNIKITLDVIDSNVIENEDGSVVIAYDEVIIGADAVSAPEDYKDYLFAGWYTDASCETAIKDAAQVTESSYALFKPSSILDVKIQITDAIVTGETNEETAKYNDNYVIRFVSSVDCLDYKKVGFVVESTDGTYKGKSSSTTVFKGIESSNKGSEYNFSPKVIAEQSAYLMTAKLPVLPDDADKDYIVRAYWETMDGTVVYGNSRCVSVKDNNVLKADTEADTINMVVNGELTGTGYTASFTSSSDNSVTTDDFTVSGATVEVLNVEDGYSNIRITLPAHGDYDKMASLTKITIDDTDYYGMFRNYYTSHESGDVLNPHADTSWYYASEDTSKFVIASSADLYGLAEIVNEVSGTTFTDKKVTLVGDITVNEGTTWMNTESVDTAYVWNPIGQNAYGISWYGTFDGDGNSISGLYTVHLADGTGNYDNPNSTNAYVGLFGTSREGSVIKNVALTNSYFYSDGTYVGGIVGWTKGSDFEDIYCDAKIVVSNTSTSINSIGGIIGCCYAKDNQTVTRNLKRIWFDGDIEANGLVLYVGGLVGYDYEAYSFEMTDCLYTGNINYNFTGTVTEGNYKTTPNLGGLIAYQSNLLTKRKLLLTNCIVAGSMNAIGTGNDAVSGYWLGRASHADTSKVTNCHITCTLTVNGVESTKYIGSNHKDRFGDINCVRDNTYFQNNSLTTIFGEDHVWATVEGMDVPVLAEFAHTWQKLNNNN